MATTHASKQPARTVLIVDDYPMLAAIVETRLRAVGITTRICAGGAAAIDALQEGTPDLVILDMLMPEVDGFDVMRFIRDREQTRKLPVIMLTASTSADNIARANELGATSYVTKPFNSGDLVRQVQQILNGPAAS